MPSSGELEVLHEEEAYKSNSRCDPQIAPGESERRIAQNINLSRLTVRKYSKIAREHGYLEAGQLPNDAELQVVLGTGCGAARVSSVEPYRKQVEEWRKEGVEMTAIWLRLQENYGFKGAYGSVLRFVHRLEPGSKRKRSCACTVNREDCRWILDM